MILACPVYLERDQFLSASLGLFIYYAMVNAILGMMVLIFVVIGIIIGAVLTNRLIHYLEILKYDVALEDIANSVSGKTKPA